MLSRFRRHFGSAGLVVAIIALVAALAGGAVAATGGSDGKATASAKGKQGKRGKPGKQGPAGPAGPVGPQGPAGPAGPAGAKGDTGAAGTDGAPGATGATGPAGPAGEDGETGFTETLPPEKTETGSWSFGLPGSTGVLPVPISFPIPLEEGLDQDHVHAVLPDGKEINLVGEEVTPVGCPGNAEVPLAEPGHLCVYTASLVGAKIFTLNLKPSYQTNTPGTSTAGARLVVTVTGLEANGFGSWAVTAPEE